MNELKFDLMEWQEKFIFADYKFKFLKSAWGTGKTLALILAAIRESQEYSNNVGVIFRKEYEDLRDSTIKDFETYTGLKVNSSREVKVGTSTIMFRHLEELNNIQNMNLGWFGIEQAEELDTDDQFTMLWGRLRRQGSSRRGYAIANARGHNWIYKIKVSGLVDEKTGQRIDAHYSAKTSDNRAHLPADYLMTLEIIKSKKPKTYARMVENSDEEDDLSDTIINPRWVEEAVTRQLNIQAPFKRIVSIDVARGGSDSSVFYAIGNNKVLASETWNTRNTMELVGRATMFAKKNGDIKSFAVDEIGVGGGVADRIKELGYEVVFVNAAVKQDVPHPFYNRRSQILGECAEMFENGLVQIDSKDEDLINQLSWAKWKPIKSTGILQAESKDDIRSRNGRSPDNSDAFLNGLWALGKLKSVHYNTKSDAEGWTGDTFIPQKAVA